MYYAKRGKHKAFLFDFLGSFCLNGTKFENLRRRLKNMDANNPALKSGPYGQCHKCPWTDLELSGYEKKSLRCPVCKERFEAHWEKIEKEEEGAEEAAWEKWMWANKPWLHKLKNPKKKKP